MRLGSRRLHLLEIGSIENGCMVAAWVTFGNALKADSAVVQRSFSGRAVVGLRGFPSGAAVFAGCAVQTGHGGARIFLQGCDGCNPAQIYTAACFQGWPWTGPRGFPSGAVTVQFCAVEDVRAGRGLGHEVFLQSCGACSLCSGGLTAGEDVTSRFSFRSCGGAALYRGEFRAGRGASHEVFLQGLRWYSLCSGGRQVWPWVEPRGFPSGAALVAACAVEASGLTVDETTVFLQGLRCCMRWCSFVQ